jgi:hypothetical protein
MIVALGKDGSPTEVVAHGSWSPEDLEACVRASSTPTDDDDAKKVTVKREQIGEYVRLTPKIGEKTPWTLVVGKQDARLWLSFREGLDEKRARELFESTGERSDIGVRMGGKVDLGAPIWVLADSFPADWKGRPESAWGHLDLWDVLQIDATLNFEAEEKAERASNMFRGYTAIFENIEDGPKLDLKIERKDKQVVITGSVPIPKDANSTFKLDPTQTDSGLGISLNFKGGD